MKKELTVSTINGLRCYFDGKSISVANAAKMIVDYCEKGAWYELKANVKIFDSKAAKDLRTIKAAELSKIEWVKDSTIMKPIDGENGIEFVIDPVKEAELNAKIEMRSAIRNVLRFTDEGKKQVELVKLAELAKKYPHIYAQVLEDKKDEETLYADSDNCSAFKELIAALEKIANAIETAEDDGSNDEPETDFLATLDTSIDEDNETEELIDAAENKVLIVADQFTALELVEDYYPNLTISGKLTKSNGVLTAINNDGVQVAIHDDHLKVDSGNGIWRIDYDIAETEFRRVLREVTLKMIEKGANCPTFEIVGKSGLIYTYTEATLKPIFTETQIEHDTRINSAPPKNLKIEVPANVNELWKILRQKQQALKAIMTENSIAATRKYNVQFAEIKVIVNEINRLTQTAAA